MLTSCSGPVQTMEAQCRQEKKKYIVAAATSLETGTLLDNITQYYTTQSFEIVQ